MNAGDVTSVELFCRNCKSELICTVTVIPLDDGRVKLIGNVEPCSICSPLPEEEEEEG